jgi:hypothetical protein
VPHTGAIPAAGPSSFGSAGGGRTGGPGGGQGRGGGMGGLLNTVTPGQQLASLLHNTSSTWAAAAVGSNNAAGYQLASGRPVLAVGGFNGTDPFPTLEQFQAYVHNGAIGYFVGGTLLAGNSGSDLSAQIADWVARNYQASTVDGVTVYDLGGSQQ